MSRYSSQGAAENVSRFAPALFVIGPASCRSNIINYFFTLLSSANSSLILLPNARQVDVIGRRRRTNRIQDRADPPFPSAHRGRLFPRPLRSGNRNGAFPSQGSAFSSQPSAFSHPSGALVLERLLPDLLQHIADHCVVEEPAIAIHADVILLDSQRPCGVISTVRIGIELFAYASIGGVEHADGLQELSQRSRQRFGCAHAGLSCQLARIDIFRPCIAAWLAKYLNRAPQLGRVVWVICRDRRH